MQRSERLLRASAAACLSTGVAVAMHVAGGGAMPSAAGLAVPLFLALAVSAQLAGAASRWRLALAVALSQLGFHTLFSWGVGASMRLAPGQGAHAGHDPLSMSLTVASGGEATHMAMALTPEMIAAHVLAALGTYAVLRRADVLLESGRRWAHAFLARLQVPAPWRPAPLGVSAPSPRPAPRRARVVTLPRGVRGPPLSLA